MVAIQYVVPQKNGILEYGLSNGVVRKCDLSPFFSGEAFKELQDFDEFCKVKNGKYYLEWENGADISLDTLEATAIS